MNCLLSCEEVTKRAWESTGSGGVQLLAEGEQNAGGRMQTGIILRQNGGRGAANYGFGGGRIVSRPPLAA
jgi:hypothetical protein